MMDWLRLSYCGKEPAMFLNERVNNINYCSVLRENLLP